MRIIIMKHSPSPVVIKLCFVTRKYTKRNERVIADGGKYANFNTITRQKTFCHVTF